MIYLDCNTYCTEYTFPHESLVFLKNCYFFSGKSEIFFVEISGKYCQLMFPLYWLNLSRRITHWYVVIGYVTMHNDEESFSSILSSNYEAFASESLESLQVYSLLEVDRGGSCVWTLSLNDVLVDDTK